MGQFLSGSLQNQRGQQQQGRQNYQRAGPHQGIAVSVGISITKAMNNHPVIPFDTPVTGMHQGSTPTSCMARSLKYRAKLKG